MIIYNYQNIMTYVARRAGLQPAPAANQNNMISKKLRLFYKHPCQNGARASSPHRSSGKN